MKVEKATEDDLTFILDWLKREHDEGVDDSFWCNNNLVRKSFRETDDLWVVRIDGEAVGFQVGNDMKGIVNVRKDMRGRGVGEALFNATLARAKANNVTALYGECAPTSSLSYWEKHGFERFHYNGISGIWVRRILQYKHTLPEDRPTAQVHIEFIAPNAYYRNRENPNPIAIHDLTGVVIGDEDMVLLPERVIFFTHGLSDGYDTFVRITVDGVEWYFDKAKYDDAEAIGIRRDDEGGTFYIDHIT